MEYHKQFVKELESMARYRSIVEVFNDVVGMIACGLEQLSIRQEEREKRYLEIANRYEKSDMEHVSNMFVTVIDALTHRRESFLGPVLESIGAANTHNGQFLTPNCVARVMANINAGSYSHNPGELITINDPAVGAGVTMIHQAEALLEKGVSPRDIYIECGDIDLRACDMTFIELTLLGYSAKVEHKNALSMKEISRPRYTFCFYMFGTQFRLNRRAA